MYDQILKGSSKASQGHLANGQSRLSLWAPLLAFIASFFLVIGIAKADDSDLGEQAQEWIEDTGDALGEQVREARREGRRMINRAEEEVCKMVDGTLECVPKKMEHRAQEAKDKAEDTLTE